MNKQWFGECESEQERNREIEAFIINARPQRKRYNNNKTGKNIVEEATVFESHFWLAFVGGIN